MHEENGFTTLDAEELRAFAASHAEGEYALIDVRQPKEYASGHIPGARSLPLPELEAALPGLDPDKRPVFYCRGGVRSRLAAKAAAQSSLFPQGVYNLDKGISGWDGQTLPHTPRLAVFAGLGTPRDLLLKALELEKAALTLYSDMASLASHAEVRSLAADLAALETAHVKVVYAQLKDQWREPGMPGLEALLAGLSDQVLEGGGSVKELRPWIAKALKGGGMQAAELALEIESAAYDLYRVMADAGRDAVVEEVFLSLAEQEKVHARLIMRRLDDFAE